MTNGTIYVGDDFRAFTTVAFQTSYIDFIDRSEQKRRLERWTARCHINVMFGG